KPGGTNNFQARYAIRHPWRGPIACADPTRGRWGGPPNGEGNAGAKPALKLAFQPRGQIDLGGFFKQPVPELSISPTPVAAAPPSVTPAPVEPARGCASCTVGDRRGAAAWGAGSAALLALFAVARRRRRSR